MARRVGVDILGFQPQRAAPRSCSLYRLKVTPTTPSSVCPEPSFSTPENVISRGTTLTVVVGLACCASKKGTSKVTHTKIAAAAKSRPLVAGFTGIRPPDLSLVLLPPTSSPLC